MFLTEMPQNLPGKRFRNSQFIQICQPSQPKQFRKMKFVSIFLFAVMIVRSTSASAQSDGKYLRDQANAFVDCLETKITNAESHLITHLLAQRDQCTTKVLDFKKALTKRFQPFVKNVAGVQETIIDQYIFQFGVWKESVDENIGRDRLKPSFDGYKQYVTMMIRAAIENWAIRIESGEKPLSCIKSKIPKIKDATNEIAARFEAAFKNIEIHYKKIFQSCEVLFPPLATAFNTDINAKCKNNGTCMVDYVRKFFDFRDDV